MQTEAQYYLPDTLVSFRFSNQPLSECLHLISNRTGIRFGYRTSLIDTLENISIVIETKNSKTLLDSLLIPIGIDYVDKNRQIILKKRSDKLNISGRILSLTDSLPIPYASLSLKGKSLGTITDFKGNYQWDLSEKYSNETIIISSMGFTRKHVKLKELASHSSKYIFLEPSFIDLDPVVIRKRDFRIEILGNKGNKPSGSIYLDTHGQQTGLYIENDHRKEGTLLSVEYYLAEEGNLNAPLRVRIYEVDSLTGIPVKDILDEMLIAKPDGEKGWFQINLSEFNILFPEKGLFIAVEGIFPDEYEYYTTNSEFIDIKNKNVNTPIKDNLPQSLSYGQQVGYNRKLPDKTWHYSISQTWFQLHKQQYGILIRARVKFEKQKRKKRKIK